MPASGSPIDVTNAIEQAPFGRFQLIVTALCAWIALLDGFDTQAIADVAPVIAEQWQMNMAGFGRSSCRPRGSPWVPSSSARRRTGSGARV